MPAKSKKQQRLMAMAYSYAKGEMKGASDTVKSLSKSFLKKGKKKGIKKLRDFAATKHEGLPMNVERRISTFESFVTSVSE